MPNSYSESRNWDATGFDYPGFGLKCPEHGWEPKPFSLEKTLAKIRWVLSRLGWSP